MRVCEFIAGFLETHELGPVFTLPGGMISPLLDAIHRRGSPRLVTVYHEQAAGFAVDAFGKMSGRPAVALATVGPGALNLLNGVASCYFDSSPALFLTGGVQTFFQRGAREVRQFGFQEVQIESVIQDLVKGVWQVTRPGAVPGALADALATCISGRPGPVLVNLPFDVQSAELAEPVVAPEALRGLPPLSDPADVARVLDAVRTAKRPLAIAGGGIRASQMHAPLRALVHRLRLPLASTIMALDVLPTGDPLRAGMLGMYGNRWTNRAVIESDLLLVLGSRLDPSITTADVQAWKRNKTIVQVDCDPAELQARMRRHWTIEADLGTFVTLALAASADADDATHRDWIGRIEALRDEHPDLEELKGCPGINPNEAARQITAAACEAGAIVVDAGQHTWWVAQSAVLHDGQRFIAASGLGSIGFALPGAVGATLACRYPTLAFTGDGCLQANIQELQTVVREALPVKLVVFHNACHGMVRQFQENTFEARYPTTLWGYSAPDFEAVGRAFQLDSRSLSRPDELEEAVAWLWTDPRRPALLQIHIDPSVGVYPNVPFGQPITAMQSYRAPHSVH